MTRTPPALVERRSTTLTVFGGALLWDTCTSGFTRCGPKPKGPPGGMGNLEDQSGLFFGWLGTPNPSDSSVYRRRAPLAQRYENNMQSFATGRVNEGGNRMEPLGIRITDCVYLAAGAGELKLASADSNFQPILDYNYLDDPFDRDRLREMVRLCVKLGEHESF